MKLFAVDPDLGDGISTYMNVVVVQGAPDDVTREDYFEAISAEVEGADVTDLREERIELPAGEALQLTFEHSQSGVEKPLPFSSTSSSPTGLGTPSPTRPRPTPSRAG